VQCACRLVNVHIRLYLQRCIYTHLPADLLINAIHGVRDGMVSSNQFPLTSDHLHPAVLIGIAMGVLGFAVDWAVVTLNGWKYGVTRAAIAHSGGFWVPYLAFCGISVG
jgi:hypothetical protein